MRGPQTHKPFTGVPGGETRMWPFIYFGFHFSLFNMHFQECSWIFKETGLPFPVDVDSLFFSLLKKKGVLIF